MVTARTVNDGHRPGGSSSSRTAVPPQTPPLPPSPLASDSTPTPIRGDFITVNRSASPRRKGPATKDVVLHLSLTDSQMDRLTDVIARPESPQRGIRRDRIGGAGQEAEGSAVHVAAPSNDPFVSHACSGSQDHASLDVHRRESQRWHIDDADGRPATQAPSASRSKPATKRSRSPAKNRVADRGRGDDWRATPSTVVDLPTLAQRRGVPRPSIDTTAARMQGSPSCGQTFISITQPHNVHGHPTAVAAPSRPSLDVSPSVYSADGHSHCRVAAGNATSSKTAVHVRRDSVGVHNGIDSRRESATPVSPRRIQLVAAGAAGAEQTEEVLRSLAESDGLAHLFGGQAPPPSGFSATAQASDHRHAYSPLTPYVESMNDKAPRRKVLIGEHGWLERTGAEAAAAAASASTQQQQQPKRGILQSIKRVARDVVEMADAATTGRRGPRLAPRHMPTRLDISMDPREQSLFYCELEFLLTTGLDGYLTSQFNAGRLQADKMKKVADGWAQKGRPKVVGFRYDVETQLDLVLLHLHDFKFYGVACGSVASVAGVLDMMRANARAMRVRTFCQPDLVVAKQLLDSQKLFNILGCSDHQQIQLHEVVQFFKVILERERYFHGVHRH